MRIIARCTIVLQYFGSMILPRETFMRWSSVIQARQVKPRYFRSSDSSYADVSARSINRATMSDPRCQLTGSTGKYKKKIDERTQTFSSHAGLVLASEHCAPCGSARFSLSRIERERQCLFSYASRLPSSTKSMLDPCSIRAVSAAMRHHLRPIISRASAA